MWNLQDLSYIDSIDSELDLIEKETHYQAKIAKPFEIDELLHIFEDEDDEDL